ncbi:hypothetical protein HY641_03215 [Candidatus Woesearchaeota archaeon]|nr:hypothetical protein [Candidatus Woesearchaeota archaeon]
MTRIFGPPGILSEPEDLNSFAGGSGEMAGLIVQVLQQIRAIQRQGRMTEANVASIYEHLQRLESAIQKVHQSSNNAVDKFGNDLRLNQDLIMTFQKVLQEVQGMLTPMQKEVAGIPEIRRQIDDTMTSLGVLNREARGKLTEFEKRLDDAIAPSMKQAKEESERIAKELGGRIETLEAGQQHLLNRLQEILAALNRTEKDAQKGSVNEHDKKNVLDAIQDLPDAIREAGPVSPQVKGALDQAIEEKPLSELIGEAFGAPPDVIEPAASAADQAVDSAPIGPPTPLDPKIIDTANQIRETIIRTRTTLKEGTRIKGWKVVKRVRESVESEELIRQDIQRLIARLEAHQGEVRGSLPGLQMLAHYKQILDDIVIHKRYFAAHREMDNHQEDLKRLREVVNTLTQVHLDQAAIRQEISPQFMEKVKDLFAQKNQLYKDLKTKETSLAELHKAVIDLYHVRVAPLKPEHETKLKNVAIVEEQFNKIRELEARRAELLTQLKDRINYFDNKSKIYDAKRLSAVIKQATKKYADHLFFDATKDIADAIGGVLEFYNNYSALLQEKAQIVNEINEINNKLAGPFGAQEIADHLPHPDDLK